MFAGEEACTRIASRAETCPATKRKDGGNLPDSSRSGGGRCA